MNSLKSALAGSSLVFASLAFALPLSAQEQDPTQEKGAQGDPLAPLQACRAIGDDTARLACFDRAAGDVLAARDKGDVQFIDRKQVRETRRRLFGFALPDLGIFNRKDDREDEDEETEVLNTTIASVRRANYTYLIETAEGAVWQLNEVPRRLMSPKPGQPLEISRGALSSYFLKINGQLGVKGVRVE